MTVFIIFGNQDFTHIVIACNTAHIFIDEIEAVLGKRPLSLIELTVANLVQGDIKRVGLLASPTTIKTKLYESALNRAGLEVCTLGATERARTEELIRRTIAGKEGLANRLNKQIQHLAPELVILGCTELSVIAAASISKNVIDPLAIVVAEIFCEARHG